MQLNSFFQLIAVLFIGLVLLLSVASGQNVNATTMEPGSMMNMTTAAMTASNETTMTTQNTMTSTTMMEQTTVESGAEMVLPASIVMVSAIVCLLNIH